MGEYATHRIRLKLPSGAEIEVEGSPEFVYKESKELLGSVQGAMERPGSPLSAMAEPGAPNIAWEAIIEHKGRNIQLRGKLAGDKSEKDACLVLLAASHRLLNLPKPTATQLAKWLRASGYPIQRMDRALQDGVAKGEILSSGSRRARRYELTVPGRLKAHILANQLSTTVTGLP